VSLRIRFGMVGCDVLRNLALTGINASFGTVIAIGLTVIGVPNPVLWGIVGAVLRFVPYIGARPLPVTRPTCALIIWIAHISG
jgi:predicted PurR-regulated permease PerM